MNKAQSFDAGEVTLQAGRARWLGPLSTSGVYKVVYPEAFVGIPFVWAIPEGGLARISLAVSCISPRRCDIVWLDTSGEGRTNVDLAWFAIGRTDGVHID